MDTISGELMEQIIEQVVTQSPAIAALLFMWWYDRKRLATLNDETLADLRDRLDTCAENANRLRAIQSQLRQMNGD